ncbi:MULTISPECIES: NAD(+) diphosphatase [Mumia]|uniref:NAD(+) diphosphatase n=1 Tax=Mumia TaxID=1546255 RepID=UPI001FB86821|nr:MULTISPECIES: NAD(+) diphosphatase [unclassified Mumia]
MTEGFTFADGAYNRHSERRVDDAFMDALWADPKTPVLVVGGEHLAADADGLVWRSPADVPDGDRLYLGTVDGTEYAAVMVRRVPEPSRPLRAVATSLPLAQARLAVHAVGVAQWHRTHPRCARCGSPTDVVEGGHVRRCPECGAQHFPRTDPAVIMLITDDADRALLGRRPDWPATRFSTLAGFVEPGESLEDAVRRETWEEAGVEVGEVSYAASQPWPFPSSLMLGFFGRARTTRIAVDGTETADARWFGRDEVTRMTASGELDLPGTLSISRWLIERWHGGLVHGEWR